MAVLAVTLVGMYAGTALTAGTMFAAYGASAGALIGAYAGNAMFGPKGVPPPIQDLKLDAASYGHPINIAYGTMRVGANYIWGPDKVAHEHGGKGGDDPEYVTYTASFAVGLCEGPQAGVIKVWLDSKLVYDVTDENFGVTQDQPIGDAMTIYLGGDDQLPDPTMVATDGAELTPAYRGLCYLMFRDLDLTPYGGRWPVVSALVSPAVPSYPARILWSDVGVPLDTIYINPVIPYVYVGPGTFIIDTVPTPDRALLISRDAAAAVGFIEVKENPGSHISPNPDGSGFWHSWENYIYDAEKGIEYDPTGIPINTVLHYPGTGGAAQIDYCDPTLPTIPYDAVDGATWASSIETPNEILVCVRSDGSVEGWVTSAANRVSWYDDVMAGTGVGSITYNPTPGLSNSSITGWPTACRTVGLHFPAYTCYFIVHDAGHPVMCSVLDTSGTTTEPLLDSLGNNTIEVSSPIWDMSLNGLFAVGQDVVEIDPVTLLIKSWSLLASDGVTYIVAYSDIIRDVGRDTYGFSNEQSQRFTHGKFWTSLAIQIDLDALRPRLDSDDNVVYGTAIIEDNSGNPWAGAGFNGGFRAMAYDALTDSFYATNSASTDVWQLFLHRAKSANNPLALAELVTAISARVGLLPADLDVSQLTDTVDGYLIPAQTTGRAALEQLMAAYAFGAVESDGKIKFVKRGGASAVTIPQSELAAHFYDSEPPTPLELTRALEQDLPLEINDLYYNLAADYQQGQQRARRVTTTSTNVVSVNFGVALTDDHAKQIAERLLWCAWLVRTQFSLKLSKKYAYLEPTDIITVGDSGFVMRLTQTNFDQAVVSCEAALEDSSIYQSFATGGIAPIGSTGIVYTGPTLLVILDSPSLREVDATSGLYVAACGYTDSWRGCIVTRDGAQLVTLTTEAVIGRAITVLGDGTPYVFDESNSVDISLTHGGMELYNATELAVLSGTNWAWLNGEIFGFKNATFISGTVYRLSGLLRGRQGTEFKLADHAVGDLFVLLEAAALRWISGTLADVGVAHSYKALSLGSQTGIAQSVTSAAVPLRPYSVVQPRQVKQPNGDIIISWVGRSLHDHDWLNNIDVPIDRTFTDYRLEILSGLTGSPPDPNLTILRSLEVQDTTYTYIAANQTNDFGAPQDLITVNIGQRNSDYGVGEMIQLTTVDEFIYSPPEPLPIVITPPGVVDYEFTWPADEVRTSAPMAGRNFVIGFTTSSATINSGLFVVAEYGYPPTSRRVWIALDAAGAQPVGPVSIGTTASVFFGIGNTNLLPNTRYYFIHQIDPAGGLANGTHVGSVFSLGSVT